VSSEPLKELALLTELEAVKELEGRDSNSNPSNISLILGQFNLKKKKF